MSQQQTKSVSIGQAFGIFLSTIVAALMFIPRLVQSANKAMDMVDNVVGTGVNITTTMLESSEDFRNTSKLESDAKYQARLNEINKERAEQGLPKVEIQSVRTVSDTAQEALAKLGVSSNT